MSAPRSHLSAADLTRLRAKLERERAALLRAQADTREQARNPEDRDATDDADVAERMIEQEELLRRRTFDRALLDDVERAIAKLEAGTYGVSEDSGAPIPLERLEAVPWARRTTQEEERRGR